MIRNLQPSLFDVDESIGALEFFPEVWNAAEDLVSPNVDNRRRALARLDEINAARFSPLVAYLLATRISDSDLTIRRQAIRMLGELLIVDAQGRLALEPIRQYLSAYIKQMRTRSVYCLLQAADTQPDIHLHVARLLNLCSFAGKHLLEIITDRKVPLAIRIQAVRFIGMVGYLDAIQPLERLYTRLDSRINGQQSMPFSRGSDLDESALLPHIHMTLSLLRQP